jgi:hypothetical protein
MKVGGGESLLAKLMSISLRRSRVWASSKVGKVLHLQVTNCMTKLPIKPMKEGQYQDPRTR